MAWRCSANSNVGLIENLRRNGIINTPRIKEAMLKVDRGDFSPESPYQDSPQRIGYDATISAPHIHANALETLNDYLKPGAKVLDIGSGSGYLCAVMAHLVTPGGRVIGIDHIPQITNMAVANLSKRAVHKQMLDDGTITIVTGDGRKGYAEEGPYDAIHVGAAAKEMHHQLIDQLKAPGRMFIPVAEEYSQYVWQIDKKSDGEVVRRKLYGVMYVPLTDAKEYDY